MLTALQGIRVLDLTRILAGPFGTMLLADLGAEVIKIERPGTGDDTRSTGPHFIASESVYFMSVNRGKKSVCLDLSVPAGQKVLHDLAARCDVLVENFRPGVSRRLGCDPDTLWKINPRLIVCSITAFGHTGPDRDQPAFDLTLQARGGTMALTGEPGRMPVRMGPPIGDLAGGLYAALAIASALYERTHTNKGRFIDLSLLDCQVSLLVYAAAFQLNGGTVLGPQGSAHTHAFPYQVFPTADIPIAVAVFTDRFWPGFCRAIGEPSWANDPSLATHAQRRDPRHQLVERITQKFLTRSVTHWLAALRAEHVPAAPVQTIDKVFQDPQVLARGMIAQMHHPTAGCIRTAGNPIQMHPHEHTPPPDSYLPPPRLGEHTREVLRTIAGYDDGHIHNLHANGVVSW